MYLSYQLQKNDKLKYARAATRTQQRTTYYLTYGLINLCIIMLVLSFCFYYFSTPIVIEHVDIPPRDELGIFFITLFFTVMLGLLAWHFKRQFSYLFQLALQKTNYTTVELWADAKQLRCILDGQEYLFDWENVTVQSNHYQTCLMTESVETISRKPLLLIPAQHLANSSLLENINLWRAHYATI